MKKILLIVLMLFFPLVICWAGNPLFQNPTPEQSYISTNTTTNTVATGQNAPIATPTVANAGNSNQATTKLTKQVMPIAPITNIQDPAVKQTVRELQAQLSDLNQLNLLFQQQTDQRLENLSNVNAQFQNKIKELAQAIGLLNQELTQVAKSPVTNHQQVVENSATYFHDKVQTLIAVLLIAILIALIILIAVMMRRQKPRSKIRGPQLATANNAVMDEDDTKDEYDFMNSNEAIPAKLDLARAYFDMEDYQGAREALNQVMVEGDPEQRQEAQTMLSKIPHNK